MKEIPLFFKSKNKKNNSVTTELDKKEDFKSFFKTLVLALICAGFVRSFFYEPFHIPSSSMKPNLLIGDYIFVSKYSYGYSKYSFPFSLNLFVFILNFILICFLNLTIMLLITKLRSLK